MNSAARRERLAQEEQEHSITLRDLADAKARAGRQAILVFVLGAALILSIPAHATAHCGPNTKGNGRSCSYETGEPVKVKYWKPQ